MIKLLRDTQESRFIKSLESLMENGYGVLSCGRNVVVHDVEHPFTGKWIQQSYTEWWAILQKTVKNPAP